MKELRNLLSQEQWAALQRRSLPRALWALCVNWGLVAGAFALATVWPNALGFLLALILLGGRQLGLGILMHDRAHRGLLPSSKANDWVGQWPCAAPMFADLEVYRRYHMTYPDPCAVAFGYSYRREVGHEQAGRSLGHLLWNLHRILLVQALGLALLWALGHPMLYVLWPASWLTSYMLFSRIRNAAEHGGLPGTMSTNHWLNTRSVKAGWLARLTVAPNHVNWHFEHHLAPTVPGYRLGQLHRALARQPLPDPLPLWPGYGAVIRSLVQR